MEMYKALAINKIDVVVNIPEKLVKDTPIIHAIVKRLIEQVMFTHMSEAKPFMESRIPSAYAMVSDKVTSVTVEITPPYDITVNMYD